MFRRRLVILMVLLFAQSMALKAQNKNPITSDLQAFKITQNSSREEIATAVKKIKPGDTIEYQLTYTNNSENAISDLVPVLPIPVGMQYLEETAAPGLNGASTTNTGKNFKATPLTRMVTNDRGQEVTEKIPAREYRRLQWLVSTLQAGESITLKARVEVVRGQ